MSAARPPGSLAWGLLLALASLLCLAGASRAAGSGGIGSVVVVQREVLGREPGPPVRAERQLRFDEAVADGLHVRLTQGESLLKVRFVSAAEAAGAAAAIPAGGTYTLFGRCEAVFRQGPAAGTAGRLLSSIQLLLGRLRLALLPGGEQPAEVGTPEAVVGVKGTFVRLLVDPAIGTFVAVDEGVAAVQARAGGGPVTVHAGSWVLVPPGGLATRPAPLPIPGPHDGILDDPPLLPTRPPNQGFFG